MNIQCKFTQGGAEQENIGKIIDGKIMSDIHYFAFYYFANFQAHQFILTERPLVGQPITNNHENEIPFAHILPQLPRWPTRRHRHRPDRGHVAPMVPHG